VKYFLDLTAAGGAPIVEVAYTWLAAGKDTFEIAFYFDRLTAVMALIVTGVGSLIHVYSVGYMKEDASYARYFAYLNLFLFFMLMLVLGRSLLVLFVGWEGVGLASYLPDRLLVRGSRQGCRGQEGLHHQPHRRRRVPPRHVPHLPASARSTWTASTPRSWPRPAPAVSASLVGILLFIGAVRQVGADPAARVAARRDGGTDAGLGADPRGDHGDRGRVPGRALSGILPARARGLRRDRRGGSRDRVLRRDHRPGADRHQEGARLLDHLAARVHVPRARRGRLRCRDLPSLHARLLQGVPLPRRGERDPRALRRAGRAQDGRAREEDPGHFATFAVATGAIAGLPPLAGFFSKDEIVWFALASARGGSGLLFALAAATALLTSFYMFRLLWLTFLGRSRMTPEAEHHVHESPPSMTAVLAVLAVLSAVGGFLSIPHFLEPLLPLPAVKEGLESYEHFVVAASIAIALAGLAGAAGSLAARPRAPSACGSRSRRSTASCRASISWTKAYEAFIGKPLIWVSDRVFLRFGDQRVLDGSLHGLAALGNAPRAVLGPHPGRI
jgi:NADH-quinone oxidoreductase subunit L